MAMADPRRGGAGPRDVRAPAPSSPRAGAAPPASPRAGRLPPEPPLADEAVLLRPPRDDDAAAIAAACADAEIARWVPIPVPYTVADARAFIELTRNGWAEGSHATLAIESRADGSLAGMISLERGSTRGRASIGYWLAPWARGYGLASRSVRLVAAWAFEDPQLERLELTTLVGNDASGRVALRSGFLREGILRRYLQFRGRAVDSVMYAMVRDEPTPGDGARLPPAETIAADLLHGPGAATSARRLGIGQLGEALDAWDRASVALGALTGTGGPMGSPLAAELLDTLREEMARRASDPPAQALPVADRRDAMATLLGSLGVAEPREPAAALDALGWDGNELDDLLAPFGTDEARLVVATWMAATALVRRLLAETQAVRRPPARAPVRR